MSALGCGTAQEQAPELALGILGGAERAELLLHVNGCARCQAVIGELTEVADLLPLLAPEAEPPAGFEERVLAAARGDRWRSWRRRALILGAVAAAAASLSIVTVRVIDAGRDTTDVAATPVLRSAPMVGGGGMHVGHVTVSNGAPAAVGVTVDYAVADGSYTLQLRPDGGAATDIGTIAVAGSHGEWSGDATIPHGTEVRLAMVNAQDVAVCEATLPTSASALAAG
jgi:hypothetical protein